MSKEKSIRKQVEEKLTEKFGFWNVAWNTLKIRYSQSYVSVRVSNKDLELHFDGLIYEA